MRKLASKEITSTSAQSQSALLCCVSHMTVLFAFTSVMKVRDQTCQAKSSGPLSDLFTDHQMSGLPMRDKSGQFRTICEQTFDNCPTDPMSSSLGWWSSRHGVATLFYCFFFFFSPFRNTVPRISLNDLPYLQTMKKRARQISQKKSFSKAPAEIFDSNMFLSLSTRSLLV